MLLKEVGNAIKNRRYELDITQRDLARMSGVSLNTIYLIETGRFNPSIETLKKILDILGLDFNIEVKNLK